MTIFIIEIEYIDQCIVAKEIYFLTHAFDQLNYTLEEFIDLKVDNQSIIKLINNSINHAKSKHIFIQYYYVREQIEKKNLKLIYINIHDMMIDDLTKTLTKNKFKKYVNMLRLIKSRVCERVWNVENSIVIVIIEWKCWHNDITWLKFTMLLALW